VVITIPAGVTPGCYVSLALVSGNIVSNWTTIPVAASGRNCPDPVVVPPVTGGSTTIRTGSLFMDQTTAITPQSTSTTNSVAGIFAKQTITDFSSSAGANQASTGSCVVYTATSGSSTGTVTTTPLDAGASIAVNGPAGNLTLSSLSIPGVSTAFYSPANSTVPGTFIPASGGTFTFDNGSGGKDVQHFTATLNMPPSLVWSNAAQVTAVGRSQGVTVNWTGGAPNSLVTISGSSSATTGGKTVSAFFTCQAPVSAGQFAVPVPVLLSLPAGSGSLEVQNFIGSQTFTAPGLDAGYLSGSVSTSKTLAYN
jgi:hypothetical protein